MSTKELVQKEIERVQEQIKDSTPRLRAAKEALSEASTKDEKDAARRELDVVYDNRVKLKSDLQALYAEMARLQ